MWVLQLKTVKEMREGEPAPGACNSTGKVAVQPERKGVVRDRRAQQDTESNDVIL